MRAQLLIAKAQVSSFWAGSTRRSMPPKRPRSIAPPGSDMWGEAQRLAAAALIEAGRSADGDARAAWALGPEFSARSRCRSAPPHGGARARPHRHGRAGARPGARRSGGRRGAGARARSTPRCAPSTRASSRSCTWATFRAIAAGDRLIEAADNAGDMVLATRGRCNTGSVLNHLGMFEEAQADAGARASTTRAPAACASWRRSRCTTSGMSYARLGNLDEGIDCQRQAARIADETGAARLRIHTRCYEAIFLVWRGAPGDLGAALTLARYVCEETRQPPRRSTPCALRRSPASSSPAASWRARSSARARSTSASPPARSRSGTSTSGSRLIEVLARRRAPAGGQPRCSTWPSAPWSSTPPPSSGASTARPSSTRNEEVRSLVELAPGSASGRALPGQSLSGARRVRSRAVLDGARACSYGPVMTCDAPIAPSSPPRRSRLFAAAAMARARRLIAGGWPSLLSAVARRSAVQVRRHRRAPRRARDGAGPARAATLKKLFDSRQVELDAQAAPAPGRQGGPREGGAGRQDLQGGAPEEVREPCSAPPPSSRTRWSSPSARCSARRAR